MGGKMKYYKHVILRSTSGSQINIPKEVWKKLGWKINEKLRISYNFDAPYDDANPVSLRIEKAEER